MTVRSQRGFTLIELMTVLAIVAILTTALATLSSGAGEATPAQTSDRLVGMMGFARLRAEAKRTTHRVRVEPDVVSVWAKDTPGFAATTYEAQPISSMGVPGGVILWNAQNTFAAAGANPAQSTSFIVDIEFRPDGSSTGGMVYLIDSAANANFSAKHRVLVYALTGNAQTREGW